MSRGPSEGPFRGGGNCTPVVLSRQSGNFAKWRSIVPNSGQFLQNNNQILDRYLSATLQPYAIPSSFKARAASRKRKKGSDSFLACYLGCGLYKMLLFM